MKNFNFKAKSLLFVTLVLSLLIVMPNVQASDNSYFEQLKNMGCPKLAFAATVTGLSLVGLKTVVGWLFKGPEENEQAADDRDTATIISTLEQAKGSDQILATTYKRKRSRRGFLRGLNLAFWGLWYGFGSGSSAPQS